MPSSPRSGPPPTAPTPGASTVPWCGAGASWRRCGRGPRRPASTSRGSWAYSDSYYDAPLLDAVAHPTAVNADVRLVALARLQGWPLRHFDLPEGVLKIAGRELQAWGRPLRRAAPAAERPPRHRRVGEHPGHRAGHRRVQPPQLLRRHRSSRRSWLSTGRSFRFLGKKEVFDVPVVGGLIEDGRWHPCQPGVRLERAAGARHPRARRPARPCPSRRRARSRGARRSSTRC